MSFIAEASRLFPAAPEAVFDALAAFSEWGEHAPRAFRPAAPQGKLSVGMRLRVRIMGLPTTLKVTVVTRAAEITWCGGSRALLHGEHRFLFEAEGTGTRVRSVETWRGALAPLVRPVVKAQAERVAAKQLEALGEYLRAQGNAAN
jgi:hypothetical protein